MNLFFAKYSGAGNDFIIIDNRSHSFFLPSEKITALCKRNTGIGADGVIFLENSESCNFKMRIFNADASEAEMCGNGIRCLAAYIYKLAPQQPLFSIESMLRKHVVVCDGSSVKVEMGPPDDTQWSLPLSLPGGCNHAAFLDTGVPHVVLFCDDIATINLKEIGPKMRYNEFFGPRGANVNLAEVDGTTVTIRTYERGVEGETEACGTGATAVALAAAQKYNFTSPVKVKFTSGDSLLIGFERSLDKFTEVTMTGSCHHVFDGTIKIPQHHSAGV